MQLKPLFDLLKIDPPKCRNRADQWLLHSQK
jgi:hypothetical protein